MQFGNSDKVLSKLPLLKKIRAEACVNFVKIGLCRVMRQRRTSPDS